MLIITCNGAPIRPKAVVQGVLAHYGRYTVNDPDHSLTFHIEGSSGDELKWKTAAASGGGSAELVWKRAK